MEAALSKPRKTEVFDRDGYAGGEAKTVLTDPLARFGPSDRIHRQLLLSTEAEREAARQIKAAADADRARTSDPLDWQAQHGDETEIYSVPADRAGQRHHVVTMPIDTYRARGLITDLQHAAGNGLYGDWARGVCGASEHDPLLIIRRSPMSGLPEYQLIALQTYRKAVAAMPEECRLTAIEVCCHGRSISKLGGKSGWRRQVLMGRLVRALEAIEPVYHLRDY